jgi:hypothetical protein
MSTLISVDWDFFIPHGMYDDVYLPAAKDTMPGMLVYDWQMSETRAPQMEDMLWRSRAAQFQHWGLDIQALMKPPLAVSDFATEISIRIGGEPLPAWHGDSHGWGGIVARDFSKQFGPLNVLNFDAHHDLGYGEDCLANYTASGAMACDNWAVIGLHEGWIKNYTVVYPDWQGRAEWEGPKRPWLKEFRSRYKITTWSQWCEKTDEINGVEAGYFCRSSSWTPPWLDAGFQELHEEFGYSTCIDCELGQAGSPFDSCKPREWDWAEVEKEIEMRRVMREKLLEMSRT